MAKKVWNVAAPIVKNLTGIGLQEAGNHLTGQNAQPDLSALNAKKQQLTNQISSMEQQYESFERDFQTRRNTFSEKQRELDATAERLLKEQESLRRAEAQLEVRQNRPAQTQQVAVGENNDNIEKQVAKVRKQLSKELARYERSQRTLIENQEETDKEYAEHRKRLEEAHKVLIQNQSHILNLIKTLPAIQKVKELHALTDNFMHNCKVFAEDPDAMVDETRIMQRKYSLKVMEVRNIMLDGHVFPGSMRIWADAAILDLHMLGFLVTQDVFSHRTVEIAKELYQGYWDQLKVTHSKHRPVGEGSDRLLEIENLLGMQFQSFDKLMIQSMPSRALPRALGPPTGNGFKSSSDRAGNSYGADGDHSDRKLYSRRSGSLREASSFRRPPTHGGELARLLSLEEELASLRMEIDGGMRNNYGADGDHFDRNLYSRGSGSLWEESARRRPPAHGGELARLGDARPLRNKAQLLSLEEELASLRMEVDRGQRNYDRDSSEERHGSGSSSEMLAIAPSSNRSALETGRQRNLRHSHDHHEHQTRVNSSKNRRESRLDRRESPDLQTQQNFQKQSHSSKGSKQRCHGRHSSPEVQEMSDDEGSHLESERKKHLSGDKRVHQRRFASPEDKRKMNDRRHRAKNEQVDQESDFSDDSQDDNLTKKKPAESQHKSGGRKHSDQSQQVSQDRDHNSVDRGDGKGKHHSSTKKKSSHKKRHSSRDTK